MYSSEQINNDIDTILKEFDWDRVQRTMLALDWKWARYDDVPTIMQMKQVAHSLLSEAANRVAFDNTKKKAEWMVATGGFRVEAGKYKDSAKIYLRLSFNVSEWDNYD